MTTTADLDRPSGRSCRRSTSRTHSDPQLHRYQVPAHHVYCYRVVAQNTVGYGGAFPSLARSSRCPLPLLVGADAYGPDQPGSGLAGGPPRVSLTFTDNATNETGFVIQRSRHGGAFVQIDTAPARNNTGSVTFVDTTVVAGNAYAYRVAAVNAAGMSAYSNTASVRSRPSLGLRRFRPQRPRARATTSESR